MNHLEANKILVDYQHGFRKRRSCETQLINTIEDLAKNLDAKGQTDVLILDLSRAFDVVPHRQLIRKLEHYGIRGKLLDWIKAWLLYRQQCVVVEGEQSIFANVDSGAPQGTVLAVLLFIIYNNDMGVDLVSLLRLFADDSFSYLAIKTIGDCHQLQRDLDKLVKWATEWQMIFNPSKCYVLRVTNKKCPIIHDYKMHNQILKSVHIWALILNQT